MSLKVFMENGHPLHDHVRRKLAMQRNFRAAIPIFDNFVPKQMQFVCPYFVSPISFVAFCMCKHCDKILHYCGCVLEGNKTASTHCTMGKLQWEVGNRNLSLSSPFYAKMTLSLSNSLSFT